MKQDLLERTTARALSWRRKSDVDDERGLHLPIPTQIVSNEEFHPPPQTAAQKQVEWLITGMADERARRLGIDRRTFLRSATGMATAFAAMNLVFGRFFDVQAQETVDGAAVKERWPKDVFIFDVQTHHVETGKQIQMPPLLQYRNAGAMWGNTALRDREHRWEDLYLANYVKEVFLDSDTTVAVLSGLPSKNPADNVLPADEMIETRTAVNGLARSRRLLSHGLFSPDLGEAGMEEMHRQHEQLKVDAWKGYPGQPLGSGSKGWWMDDEKVAYPAYEYSRKIGIRTICVHKGLPLPEWDLEHSSPRDIPKAAADFPDLNFLVYHAAFQGPGAAREAVADRFRTKTAVPWISDLCEARKKNPKMTNVYMELGTTFGMTVITQPLLCAYILGAMIQAFGEDHVLWGTDSIWWGSPQWQIEAFRRFEMPQELIDRHGFRPLTAAVKAKILGLNAARIYGIDPKARMNALPDDALTRLRKEYEAAGASPSNTQWGWVRA